MTAYNITEESSGRYLLTGELTFLSINKKTMKSFDFIKSNERCCLNLEQINSLDSAGLALIIEIIKLAEKYKTELTFDNIPPQLVVLSRLGGFNISRYIE
jgi:phospholipid transport system transporter-binding protein